MFGIKTYMLIFKARVGHEAITFTYELASIERLGNFGKSLVACHL